MKEYSLMKIYLAIVSVVGVIGMAVSFGGVLHSGAKQILITDEEYTQGWNNWEIKNCSETEYLKDGEKRDKTEEEIKKCEEETKKSLLIKRSYEFKEDLISGLAWGIIFAILFGTHFNYFRKENKGKN